LAFLFDFLGYMCYFFTIINYLKGIGLKFIGISILFLILSFNLSAEDKKDNYLKSLKKTINSSVNTTKEKIKGHSVGVESEKMTITDSLTNQEVIIYNTGINLYYNYAENNTLITSLKTGISADDVNYNSQTENVKLDYLFSLSNKFKIKLNRKLNLEIKGGINYFSFSLDGRHCKELSPLLGLGLNYKFNEKTSFTIGVNKYYQKSEFDISGFNMELRYNF
jgi:predicted 3-demethylubiquinone-9 3-methyltransferase (glyoxalase superfamily)